MKTSLRILVLISFVTILSSFQIIKTQLHITVRDGLGNTVEGAVISLYETEEDYGKEENLVASEKTDDKGKAKFKDLKAIAYYVLVQKGDKNNFGGGEQTGVLDANKLNKVTIVIE